MSKQIINIGTYPNDGTGDNLRESFIKINNNFNEVYAFSGTTGTGSNGTSGLNGTSGVNGASGTSGTSGVNGTGGGSSTGSIVTNVTYSELTTLINNNELNIGSLYLITDYQTVHRITYTSDINSGITEPLLVTASGINTLNPESYSSLYPKDVIYYNYINDQQIAPGCTKGYIYRRIDTLQNNDICFDFRHIKFRRWQIEVTDIWDSNTTYNVNDIVTYNNIIFISLIDNNNDDLTNLDIYSDTVNWIIFPYENLTYLGYSANSSINLRINSNYVNIPCNSNYVDYNIWSDWDNYISAYNNTITPIMPDNYNNIFTFNTVIHGYNFVNNTINMARVGGYSTQNNNINNHFVNNIIESNFSSNIIGDTFQNNTIKSDFNNNFIIYYFDNNNIESYFYYNTIKYEFTNNNIESHFNYNTILNSFDYNNIGSYFKNNSIINNFKYNIIGNYFNYNSIESEFNSNTIGNSFAQNTIGNSFAQNIIGNSFAQNTIGSSFSTNIILSNFNSNNIDSDFNNNSIGNSFISNSIGDYFISNSIGNNFTQNTIGSNFTMNNVCDNFNINGVLDFTSSTHVYNQYTKELFVNSDYTQRLIYDKMTIVGANE